MIVTKIIITLCIHIQICMLIYIYRRDLSIKQKQCKTVNGIQVDLYQPSNQVISCYKLNIYENILGWAF